MQVGIVSMVVSILKGHTEVNCCSVIVLFGVVDAVSGRYLRSDVICC